MKTILCVILMAAGLAAQARQRAGMPQDTQAVQNDPTVDYYRSIADYFRYSERAVDALHDKGVPAEEIPAVFAITKKSRASANQVLAQKRAGKDWAAIAKEYNVSWSGQDFVSAANTKFLAEYHGRSEAEITRMRAGGKNWIAINTELRRGSPAAPRKTTEGVRSRKR